VKFKASTLDQIEYLLVTKYTICSGFFEAIIPAVEQHVIMVASQLRFLNFHTSDVSQHKFNRSRVATLLQDTDFQGREKLLCI